MKDHLVSPDQKSWMYSEQMTAAGAVSSLEGAIIGHLREPDVVGDLLVKRRYLVPPGYSGQQHNREGDCQMLGLLGRQRRSHVWWQGSGTGSIKDHTLLFSYFQKVSCKLLIWLSPNSTTASCA